MVRRLNSGTLETVPRTVRRPRYDRTRLETGICHLGLGAFARAHLLTYTEDVLEQAAPGRPLDWGVTGASLQSPDQRDRIVPQDGLYTAIERRPEGPAARIFGSLRDVLVAPENPGALLEVLAAPSTRIVTMTVTEKGYCLDPATGALRSDHPDIRTDLANPDRPVSVLGYLVNGLRLRRERGLPPFTAVCCDNLTGNGEILRGLVLAHAAMADQPLSEWIAAKCAFPSTMVDRIVPAASADDLIEAERLTGLEDLAALSHEPFRQWVIENRFVNGDRPAWEEAGAELVNDVAPYERMKLRMLNGAHSALAYLGYLAGHETIGAVMDQPSFMTYCKSLWREEVIPTLADLPQPMLAAYARSLAERFANPNIRHRTWQIAMDGSQKLQQRILPTLTARAGMGLAAPRLSLAVAAWIRYVGGTDETGAAIDVRDPMAATLRQTLERAGGDPAARVQAILSLTSIFPPAFATDHRIARPIIDAYTGLLASGAAAMVAGIARKDDGHA